MAASYKDPRGASKLFAQAEEAIESKGKAYNIVEKEWKDLQRLLGESVKDVKSSSALFEDTNKDMLQLEGKIQNLVQELDTSRAKLSDHILALRESTGAKYSLAEASSQTQQNPGKTASLFKAAQDEASILAENEKILQDYDLILKKNTDLVAKAGEVITAMKEIISQATAVLNEENQGIQGIEQGIKNNIQVCKDTLDKCTANGDEGIFLTKRSGSTVEKDLTKYSNLRKYFGGAVKAMESVENDLDSISALITSLIDKENQWESETKLRLKVGKPLIATASSKLDAVRKSSLKTTEHFVTVFDKLEKTNSKSLSKELDSKLKALINDLQMADRSGKTAEKLLKLAREAGDREAEKYLRYAPTPPSPAAPQANGVIASK